ncbi:MAG: chemotaxis protein CheW [Robiginitomaculum sp.]|nr:chemotaxis protein CheW [Robiginitomaculum sp.]MDQ7076565.1 chemotaxis protein CheW [Robiginitomaculum sp.]
MDDLLEEFLTETAESLETVDAELVKFEQNPNDEETLNNIFRLVHTIKGTCGFLGLPRLEALAHAGETLLGKYRDKALVPNSDTVSLILNAIDQLKVILAHLGSSQSEPEGDDADMIAQLVAASEGKMEVAAKAPVEAEAEPVEEPAPQEEATPEVTTSEESGESTENYDADLDRPLRPGEVSLADLERAFMEADGPDLEKLAAEAEQTRLAEEKKKKEDAEKSSNAPTVEVSLVSQSIRVNVDVLEDLMTMVSELVLTRNQLLQMVRHMGDTEIKVPLQRLSSVTAELQDGVMKTRMQPIGSAWKKLPRIVRDSAKAVGKKIELHMEGESTELDRQVLELIRDPLTHMVRNSCDHGLEPTDIRLAANKPEAGQIHLRAFHEGGHIVIEIADDGAGLPTSKIKRKAIENGIITEAQAESMTENEIHRLIFAAGLSTAKEVTSLSGRGVGMDVVRNNIEQIGGTIDLESIGGEGTTFTIKIPLTLAIVSALIVEAADSRFAIPQLSVLELVRTTKDGEHRVEEIHNTRVLRLRDTLLPLIDLADILNIPHSEKSSENAFVVVMIVGEQRFGVVVDNVFDTEEIVVKPLAKVLSGISAFSGNTILGDGTVIMIVDPNGIAKSVNLGKDNERAAENTEIATGLIEDQTAMLLFKAGGDEPKAVPLSLVTRLEEINTASIENVDGEQLVQYRGGLMPLVQIGGFAPLEDNERQPVLVFTDHGRSVGLVVDEIVDIVEEVLNIEKSANTPGIIGAAVLKGNATEVIDVGHYLTAAYHDWFENAHQDKEAEIPQKKRILLVDDNAFFRNMVAPLLAAAGYEVTAVGSAAEAWHLNETGAEFDVIVSDIEMPDETGVAFATKLATDEHWSSIPRLALSAMGQNDLDRMGATDAFTDIVRKADRESLISTIDYVLQTHGEAA